LAARARAVVRVIDRIPDLLLLKLPGLICKLDLRIVLAVLAENKFLCAE